MENRELSNTKFAGFLMTYERADILEQTIEKIYQEFSGSNPVRYCGKRYY